MFSRFFNTDKNIITIIIIKTIKIIIINITNTYNKIAGVSSNSVGTSSRGKKATNIYNEKIINVNVHDSFIREKRNQNRSFKIINKSHINIINKKNGDNY